MAAPTSAPRRISGLLQKLILFGLFVAVQHGATLPTVEAQTQEALTPRDFVIDVLDDGMDSALVRRVMGDPDSASIEENPFDTGAKLITWVYRDLEVHFASTNHVVGLAITGARVRTHRGLSVGDSATRVLDLYGEPSGRYEGTWDYSDPADRHGLHVLRVRIENGKVRWIYAGWLLD